MRASTPFSATCSTSRPTPQRRAPPRAWFAPDCTDRAAKIVPLFSGATTNGSSRLTGRCNWASGCCRDSNPLFCTDPSHLRLAPADAADNGGCSSAAVPILLRPGKTGSKHASDLVGVERCGCAQPAFHDVLLTPASVLPIPPWQPTVTVVREPCDRAASLLAHWHLMFKDHPTHPFARVRTLDHLSQFLQRDWAAVTETPRPVAGQLGFHYIVGWPQSWYVGQCTCVLCYERLDAELNGFCDRSAGNASAAEAATAASSSDHTRQVNVSSPACVAIRRLYAEDTAIHERHCRRVQSVRY